MVSVRDSLVDLIDAALPQTQCQRCGYDDCRRYAAAVATDAAPINQCPPGGAEGVARLAALTGAARIALDPTRGSEGPLRNARIDEANCIGCTLCLDACPVDCIVGGPKSLHTVIESLCTGCDLCLPVCPVDCIVMNSVSEHRTGWDAWSQAQANTARQRYAIHQRRTLASEPDTEPVPDPAPAGLRTGSGSALPTRPNQLVAAVLARVRRGRFD